MNFAQMSFILALFFDYFYELKIIHSGAECTTKSYFNIGDNEISKKKFS